MVKSPSPSPSYLDEKNYDRICFDRYIWRSCDTIFLTVIMKRVGENGEESKKNKC